MKLLLSTAAFVLAFAAAAPAQLIYSALQDNGNVLLFEQQAGGQITQLPTGAETHLFTTISRGGRFVTFSAVGPPPGNGLIASGDIYSFDRVTRQTRPIIDHTTLGNFAQQQIFSPVTASRSPDGNLLAYGVLLFQRQGLEANGSGAALIVADANTGLTISEPAPGPVGPAVDDGYGGAYRGISWAPDGNSFVTPSYFPVAQIGNIPVDGLGIVRFDRDPNTGEFRRGAPLSSPFYNTAQIPPTSTAHIFPALSPSGAGLAYFEIFYGGVVGAQQVRTSLIIANSDGSGARVAADIGLGNYPGGVSWSADGTRLFYAAGPQPQNFGSFENNIHIAEAWIGNVGTAPGSQPSLVQGLPTGALLPVTSHFTDFSRVTLTLTPAADGRFTLSASGLNPAANYIVESSTNLKTFSNQQTFVGQDLITGINIPNEGLSQKFFQLRTP